MSVKITVRDAVPADIQIIMDDICSQHRDEWTAVFSDMQQAKQQAETWASGLDRCVRADVGVLDGKPIVVFGVLQRETEFNTWLIATEKFFGLGTDGVRFTRRYMRNAAKIYSPLISVSQSTHRDVDKWLTLVGYTKLGEDDTVSPPRKIYMYGDKLLGV